VEKRAVVHIGAIGEVPDFFAGRAMSPLNFSRVLSMAR
jgi:hypothetical protein